VGLGKSSQGDIYGIRRRWLEWNIFRDIAFRKHTQSLLLVNYYIKRIGDSIDEIFATD
jgi:hypothetical protein